MSDTDFIDSKRIFGLGWLTHETSRQGVRTKVCGRVVRSRTWRQLGFKLGVSYNLFDGEELLPAAIRSIRKEVDFVTVVYQDVSNFGERHATGLRDMLSELKREGLVDSIVPYEPDLTRKPFVNEHRKRVIGVEESRRHGCTHHLDLDVDEFYRADEFARARDFIYANGICNSAVHFLYYINSPRWRLEDCRYYVPFIFRIPRHVPSGCGEYFPCVVDLTRVLRSDGRFYVFRRDEIAMHHMSTIRRNMDRKYRNSSFGTVTEDSKEANGDKIDLLRRHLQDFSFGKHPFPENVDYFQGGLVKCVDDVFAIGDVGNDGTKL